MSFSSQLKQPNEALMILATLIQAVHKSSNLEEVYRVALDSVMELENVDLAMIYLVDEENSQAVLEAHRNVSEDYIRRAGRIPYPRGITWKAINSGSIINVEDAQQDADTGSAGRDLGHHSNLGIPIFIEERVVGVIWFGSYKERRFDEREVSLLSTLGDQIAIAIAKAKRNEELQEAQKKLEERNRNLSILSAVSQAVHQSEDLNQIYRTVLDLTQDLKFIDLISLYLIEGEKDKREAVLQIHRGYPEEYLQKASKIPYPRGNTWRVIESAEAAFYEDASDPSTPVGAAGKALGQRSLLSIPIKSGSEVIGTIDFSSFTKRRFSDEEMDFLLSLGNQIGTAIAKAKMFEEMKQQAEALRWSEERYRILFDQSPVGVYIFDQEFRIIQCNERIADILRSSRDKIEGLDMRELKDQSFMPTMKKALEGETYRYEGFYEATTSPAKLWLSVCVTPLRDADGSVTDGMAVVEDITERKQVEEAFRESEERFQAFMDNSSAVTWMKDEQGRYVYLNKRFEQTFDVQLADWLGKTDFEIWPEEMAKEYRKHDLAVLTEKRPLQFSETSLNPDGCLHYWIVFKFPFRDTTERQFVGGVAFDITDLKEAEEALRENLAQLSKKNRYETIISTVTRSVHQSINLQDVLENAVHSMKDNIEKIENVSIYMVEGDCELTRAEAVIAAYRGYSDEFIKQARKIPYPKGITWKTIIEGNPIYCPDVDEDTAIGPAGRELGTKSYASMPIHYEGKTVGVININSLEKNAFNEEELRLLEIVGQQIEIAINNAKQLEALKKSEEQQALILRSVPMATYVCRACGNFSVTWVSENIEHVAGFPSKRFEDDEQFWIRRIHSDDRPRVLEELENILSKGSVALEYRCQRADGLYHWFLDQAVVVRDEDGKPKEIVGTWLDITDRKQAEQEVHKLNLKLEERVNERTSQLRSANEELLTAMEEADRANRAKSEFLSRMSHELRTPMNAILGFAQLLEMYPSSAPQVGENVKHILEGGRHLLNLINEVLDITRIDSGRLTVSTEQVSVKDVMQEALDLIQPIAAQRKIRLQSILVNDWYILADRRRIKQVLLNLLSNAVKYNCEGGLVDLSCEEVPDKMLRIKVSDTGAGIPPEKMKRLFNPFERLGAEQGSIEGTGLGLALCKQLVGAMRGIIGVESTAGQGSTFWIEMPLVEALGERLNRVGVSSKVELEADGKGRTVLYIEDDLSSLRLIEQILVHRPGIKVLSAMQGSLGLDLANENDPDLILLDLNLPDLSGEEVLCRLKEDPKTREIPVAIISANGVPDNVEKFLTLGVQAYLTKPVDIEEFLNALDNVL